MAAAQHGQQIEILPNQALRDILHSEEEVLEYAEYLGIDAERDQDLLWIAREGLQEPLPEPWWVCRSAGSGHLFFFNPDTNLSMWEHPCDTKFQELVRTTLAERITVATTLTVEASSNPFNRAVSVVGTKLSGARISVRASCPGVILFERVRSELEVQLKLPKNVVARFILADGTLLSHSHDKLPVAKLFGLGRALQKQDKSGSATAVAAAEIKASIVSAEVEKQAALEEVIFVEGAFFSL